MSQKPPQGQKIELEQKVPESLKRKTERNTRVKQATGEARKKRLEHNKVLRALYLKNAQNYAAEYAKLDRELIDNKRKARSSGGFYVPAEAKLILVVRIRGINKHSPQIRQTLRLLKLRQLQNAAFVRVNKATIEMLRKVEPYITYGYPSRALVKHLIYKRGYAKVNGQRIPITNNGIIEQQLGKVGIHSVEDLIHEIVTVGPNFKLANRFLWAFKLRSPRGGFNCKRQSFHNNGDWGNREDLINDMVKRMI
ncbi:60S ribosomal protein L7 1 [Paramecium bursaria]